MLLQIRIFLFFPIFLQLVASPAWGQPFPKELSTVIKRYTASKSLQMDVEKKVNLAVLGKETTQKGHIFISDGHLRLEFEEPDKTLVVVDNKSIWLVSYPSKELGGGVQVGHASRNSNKHPPILLKLLAQKSPEEDFKVVEFKKGLGKLNYKLEPKKKTADFTRLSIELIPDKKEIRTLTYWDELDNETKYTFIKTEWNPKLSPKLFQYSPPPGVKVTQY